MWWNFENNESSFWWKLGKRTLFLFTHLFLQHGDWDKHRGEGSSWTGGERRKDEEVTLSEVKRYLKERKKSKVQKLVETWFSVSCSCTQNMFLNGVNLFAWFYSYGSHLSTCQISFGQLLHTQEGWSKAKQSNPLTKSGMFTKFCVTTAVWSVNKTDKQAYGNHMATMKYSVLRMSLCVTVWYKKLKLLQAACLWVCFNFESFFNHFLSWLLILCMSAKRWCYLCD